MLAERTQRPLVAEIILLRSFILNEFLVFFVDGVVGEVHKLVLLVDLLSVSLACETSESLLEDVDLHRLVAGDADIDS